MKINSILDMVGNTPLLKVNNIINKYNLNANLYVKLEMFNASGSVKMRIVKAILLDAINKGLINKDTIIIEATSGNTGIAISSACAALNLKCTIIMPENVSNERKIIIKTYGANLILTNKTLGMKGSLDMVDKLVKETNNVFVLSQFNNRLNPFTHQLTTANEIYNDLDGEVDMVISGIGSGGTITGLANGLKLRTDAIIIGVEPKESPLLSKGYSNNHKIAGIGANFIPEILDLSMIDKIITVGYEESMEGLKMLSEEEGVLVGISSGAAFIVGFNEALKTENYNKNIVVIFPDGGEKYISSYGLEI